MSTELVEDNMNVFRAFSEGMHNDNLEGFMEYIDENIEWVIMATVETFRGIDEFRQLARRSMDARKHTKEAHAEFTNVFSSEDQSQMCIEYIHAAIATEKVSNMGAHEREILRKVSKIFSSKVESTDLDYSEVGLWEKK